jgi:prepilin-type N-terminal cleavage/methylation domain-containing protein
MSGSCPRSRRLPRRAGGFTLLELLVVLALVSIVAAMVAPRLQRTYDAVARSGNRAEAVRQLERLPLIARDQGRAIVVPAEDGAVLAQWLQLPSGWQAMALDPLRIEANGLCHGARIRVQGDGATETWTLSAPDCGIHDAI